MKKDNLYRWNVQEYLEDAIDIIKSRFPQITVKDHGAVFVEVAKMLQIQDHRLSDIPIQDSSFGFRPDTEFYKDFFKTERKEDNEKGWKNN